VKILSIILKSNYVHNKVMSMMVVTMMVVLLSPLSLSGSELTLGAESVISSGGGSSSGGIYGATVSISGAGATGTPNVSADYSWAKVAASHQVAVSLLVVFMMQ
jgi:hypothetical protein